MGVDDFFEFLKERFRKENPNREILNVPMDGGAGTPPQPGTAYFRVWARRMFLARERDWFHGQYPTVQSFLTFDFGGGNEPITVAHAAGPDNLASVDKDHVNRVIQINHLLSELVPFRGGSVKLEAALIATKIDDDLTRFLNVVSGFSQLVAVPQLSMAVNVATKVADGVKQLAHADGNQLVAGFTGTFAEGDGDASKSDYVLRDGLFLAIDAPARDYDRAKFEFSEGHVLYDGEPLEGVNWLLLEIETASSRPNLIDSLPTINEPFEKAVDALQRTTNGDTTAADALIKAAIVAALNSDDLIEGDRRKAAAEIKARYRARKEDILGPLDLAPGNGGREGLAEDLFAGLRDAELRELLEV